MFLGNSLSVVKVCRCSNRVKYCKKNNCLNMSKQVSLFKFYGSGLLKKSLKPNNRCSQAEDSIKRDVKMLLKEVALSETIKKKKVTDESYSIIKCDKWKKKFTFWDTEDGKVSTLFLNIS